MAALSAQTDWLDRWLARAPLPAWVLGVAFVAIVLAAVALAAGLLEDPGGIADSLAVGNRDVRFGLTITLLAAYMPLSRHYLLRAAERNRGALHRLLRPSAEPALASTVPWAPAWVALLFMLVLPLIAFAVDREPGLYFRAGYWKLGSTWARLAGWP